MSTDGEFSIYARAHPGCLLTHSPADSRAMHRAIATAWGNDRHEYAQGSEEFMLALDRTLSIRA